MSNDNQPYLSVVIPAYNEANNLLSTLQEITAYLTGKHLDYEIIVVDDGSVDETFKIVSEAAIILKSVIPLKNPANRGKGYAVKKGMLAAKGKLVLFMDADNSTRIDQLEKLIPVIDNGYDIAIASRRIPGAEVKRQPLHRHILGYIYILLSKLILGTTVKDYNCGFKLFKQDIVKKIFSRITRDDWSFDSELIFLAAKSNYKIKEIPVKWEDKRTSKVKPLRDGIKSFLSLIKIKQQALMDVYD